MVINNIAEMYILLNYLIAIIISIITAILLKLPIVPESPKRFSWTKSALFPTPIITIGILAIAYSMKLFWIYNGILLAVIISILSGFFVKYLFDYIFPKPNMG
ncbi:MAG: energy-converting hydrogenase A subunit A EhaA [Methanobrevibacter sp.]|jgi:energy-converting hydrogenase A subunit A|nr:energy-converting hydrogenase A subunit A EhaA [Candidatus Methanovirga basalitermitum]